MIITFIVILLCLTIQRIFAVDLEKPRLNWFVYCYYRLANLLGSTKWWRGFVGVLLLLLLVTAVYIVIVTTATYFLGVIFSFLFNLFVLWYYLDAKPLALGQTNKVFLPEIFISRYSAIFAVLFWYIVTGPLGVIIYGESRRLSAHLKSQQETDVYFAADFLEKLNTVRSLMDWAPVRLVGLTYALIGQFRPAFAYWCRRLIGLESEPMLIVDYGMIALNWDPNIALSGSIEEAGEIESLTNRALAVWLIVIAIFTIGQLM